VIILTQRYSRAFEMARVAHDSQIRKGTDTPYLAHVMAVSATVLEHGGDEDQAIAALLHDAAEDAGGEARLVEVEEAFGPRVGAIVRACSDSLAADPAQKAPWWERKVTYLDHLADAPDDALVVSAADKVHNAEALRDDYRREGESLWDRFNPDAGRGGQLWYQRSVADALGRRLTSGPGAVLAARLERAVSALIELVEREVGVPQVRRDLGAATARGVRTRELLVDSPNV
jgi:hypothetical protein